MHTNGPNHLRVGCRNCLLVFCEEDQRDVPQLQRRERCITRWNTRAPHPAVEVLDELTQWLNERQSAFDRKIYTACDITEVHALALVEYKMRLLRKERGV